MDTSPHPGGDQQRGLGNLLLHATDAQAVEPPDLLVAEAIDAMGQEDGARLVVELGHALAEAPQAFARQQHVLDTGRRIDDHHVFQQHLFAAALQRSMRVDRQIESGSHQKRLRLLDRLLTLVAFQPQEGLLHQIVSILLRAATTPQRGLHPRGYA